MTPAELIRNARIRHGLSQRALALRAGTTQAWVSAIERGQARPSVETLRRLLLVMGEELVIESRPLASDADQDPATLATDTRRRELLGPVRDALARMKLPPRGAS